MFLALMKYVTLEGRYNTYYFYHFPLLNHLRHKVLLSFPLFLLMDLENLVEKCVDSAALNPNEPTPLLLHQGLILRLYHFHLALCPSKPISVVQIEEIEPPTVTNLSLNESKGPARKSHPVPTDS